MHKVAHHGGSPVAMFLSPAVLEQYRKHVYDSWGIVIRDFATPSFGTAAGSSPKAFSPDRDELHH